MTAAVLLASGTILAVLARISASLRRTSRLLKPES